MGTWLHSNIVFEFEFEWDKRAVCAGTFFREFTGHIYWHAALHSCLLSFFIVLCDFEFLDSSDSYDLHLLRRRGRLVCEDCVCEPSCPHCLAASS